MALHTETQQFKVVKVNQRGQVIDRHQMEAKVFKERVNDTILEMVAIPGGTFLMGSPQGEAGRGSNENDGSGNQVEVAIAPFYMSKYPITQEQYQAVMGDNPSHFKGTQNPVETVDWAGVKDFCKKLSQLTQKNYRLPSEAEWEYAGRAGTTTPFYFGETITTDWVNYRGTFPYGEAAKGEDRRKTTPVGSFPPNAFGLYDMHGNVWEWCEDDYHENYEGLPRDGEAWVKLNSDDYHVLRGGSWSDFAKFCRSAVRYWFPPRNGKDYIGFRVVGMLTPEI
ncbi:MAG: formylglycine-generating enzyme family protein [Limnospira sp.]